MNDDDTMTYEDKVGKALMELPLMGIFNIASKVKPENIARFVSVVKSYIDRDLGWMDGWELVFSVDYRNIKKISRKIPKYSDEEVGKGSGMPPNWNKP